MARRMRRIQRIKSWLSNYCGYQDVYEHRVRQRHPNTFDWFLETPGYCRWKNAPFDNTTANNTAALKSNWPDRILFVQAKPGFGKTFLADRVIEDLAAEAEDLNISDEPPTTAFFHFNAAHLYYTHAFDAFRAIAAQLVHAHRHDCSSLDALSLLIRKTSEREKASSDDVLEILSLLLRQHSTFLVIDGIDECSDPQLFLTLLPELCRKSDARVILFSRPGLNIPLEYQKWASDAPHVISLNTSQNYADIESYLTSSLNQMADQGYFGVNLDRAHIDTVADRSNGSFLWASMLLKYLRAPDFLPDERRASLEQSRLLEGLDSLYRLILIALERRNVEQKKIAADTFRWLFLSIKRLSVPAIQTALVISDGQSAVSDRYLSDLTESIPHLTCGLVEATESSILFAHGSIKEYLQSPECRDSEFSLFDENAAHGHLTARCLSYLTNDVPKKPLQRLQPYIWPAPPLQTPSSGDISIRTGSSRDSGYKSMSPTSDTDAAVHETSTPQQPIFDTDMPFLRYAVLCWPVHLTRALSSSTTRATSSSTSSSLTNTPWLSALSQFLTERTAVTTWVESSWRYSLPPNLSRLLPLLTQLKSEMPPATVDGRELRWVINGLRELNDALEELRGQHGASLRENPSLIWQSNVWNPGQATTEGMFWPVWDERAGKVVGETK